MTLEDCYWRCRDGDAAGVVAAVFGGATPWSCMILLNGKSMKSLEKQHLVINKANSYFFYICLVPSSIPPLIRKSGTVLRINLVTDLFGAVVIPFLNL